VRDMSEAAFHAVTREAPSHFRPPPAFGQHPDARRGQAGTMPNGQTKRLAGAFSGVAHAADTSDIGEAAGGQGQSAAAAAGYSAEGGGAALFSSVAQPGSGSSSTGQDSTAFQGPTTGPTTAGGTATGVPTVGGGGYATTSQGSLYYPGAPSYSYVPPAPGAFQPSDIFVQNTGNYPVTQATPHAGTTNATVI
jgi:hypothetical protein